MRFLRLHHWLLVIGLLLAAGSAQADPALLAAINAERRQAGLGLLLADAALEAAALAHATDLTRCGQLSHRGCNGSELPDRLRQAGYFYGFAAENIALGTEDAASTLAAWLQSPSHRANLLRPEPTEAGIGRAELDGRSLWVLVLGKRY
ncbi:CAP domain-containing protein [Ferrovibrio sp.]|uniref:CAP domain-containing protein n=1 Tax=Ferrovibrio sp. TaxID=1917215 RepID=UPI0025C6323E|nr:CAP domain-containing protein [Ferrovibrio sp.]MBX3455334.1 CAP domain-containing protein [Ferrovibrio sp.]